MKKKNISIRLGLALIVSLFSVSVGASVTSDTVFTATIEKPSCSVNVPTAVPLGSVSPGTVTDGKVYKFENKPVEVSINCPAGQVPSYVWVKEKPDTGYYATATMMWIAIDDYVWTGAKGTKFELLNGGNPVVLNGGGQTNPQAGFCSGDATRTCPLIAQVTTGTEPGRGSVTMIFTLKYS
ncbi:fimbrial protein [Salmonella enterica]|nr:type 1 fimbrial protein [Salmonella enterica subsp. enterica serovar Javiana]EEL7478914.1 fimbrial protein [Salmonella enterica]EDW5422351.1 type 1 fimbrial protein [Salmonella enterica subsp. enterica serovar Javiana]EEP4893625.1 type 1 fimbrial protein [Salmonella enterica]ELD1689048.1 type 1 fimbrial protein [Salmonella enterica]